MPLKIQGTSINAESVGISYETFYSRYNQLWRVTCVTGGRPNIAAAKERHGSTRPNPFFVDCYYIDFHGRSALQMIPIIFHMQLHLHGRIADVTARYLRPTFHTFEISPYKGEKEITSLEFYPIRFLSKEEHQTRFKGNLERGKMVLDAIVNSSSPFFYSGPTLMVQPCGCKYEDGPTVQETIDSEVIVDFKLGLRRHPNWGPKREPWRPPVQKRDELHETTPVQYFNKAGALTQVQYDQVHNDYVIDREEAVLFNHKEKIFAPIPSGWISNEVSTSWRHLTPILTELLVDGARQGRSSFAWPGLCVRTAHANIWSVVFSERTWLC